MKSSLYFVCLLLFIASCQNKKYDAETYKVGSTSEKLSLDSLSQLRNECLTFMNYCDQNKTANIKRFARDWLRTWDGWKTEGVKEFIGVKSCHLSTKNRYNVKSIHLDLYTDSVPLVFQAERNFYSTEYKDLVAMVSSEFGEPDEEREGKDGIIYKWNINETKNIWTIPDNYACSFKIEYRLNEIDNDGVIE